MPHNVAMTLGSSSRSRRSIGLRAALTAIAAGTVVALSACSPVDTTPPRAESLEGGAPAAASGPLRVAVVGDSLSAGRSKFLGNGLDDKSWMTYAQGDGIEFAGGWAKAGATIEEMADAVVPVEADVLVIMAGTNDVRFGTAFADARPSYESVVDTIGADRVVIAAIPPYERAPQAAATYDADLAAWAYSEGYPVVDPWTFARGADDLWAAGWSADGIHPTVSGYERLGREFHELILDATAPVGAATAVPEAGRAPGSVPGSGSGASTG